MKRGRTGLWRCRSDRTLRRGEGPDDRNVVKLAGFAPVVEVDAVAAETEADPLLSSVGLGVPVGARTPVDRAVTSPGDWQLLRELCRDGAASDGALTNGGIELYQQASSRLSLSERAAGV